MTKHDNAIATIHMLTKEESDYFEKQITRMNNKFNDIVKQNKLQGNWTISADFKFLVKTGD